MKKKCNTWPINEKVLIRVSHYWLSFHLFGHLRHKIQVSMAFKVLLFGGFRPHLHVNNVLCLWKWWLKLSCCEMDSWSFVGFTTDVECGLIPFYHV